MNILVITAHFPHLDKPGMTYATPFLANYAKEWTKQGHTVFIVHLERVYPVAFNVFSGLMAKMGNHHWDKYAVTRMAYVENDYMADGYRVCRFLFKKYIPHSTTPKGQIKSVVSKIKMKLTSASFVPDIVFGDCLDPVLPAIKNLNFNCCIAQIVHQADFQYFKYNIIKKNMAIVTHWVVRSLTQKQALIENVGEKKIISMFSGIPEDCVVVEPTYRNKIKKLLYVGALYKSKGVETILQALSLCKNKNLMLNIIGTGTDEVYLKQKTTELGLQSRVKYLGQKPHEEVFHYMAEADCLILISHETFGMVYVEAMSQGCVPIGTYDEGIDGVVTSGVNGFLSHLNNARELAELLERIAAMDSDEMVEISKNAFKTARMLTNEKLAEKIIKEII